MEEEIYEIIEFMFAIVRLFPAMYITYSLPR